MRAYLACHFDIADSLCGPFPREMWRDRHHVRCHHVERVDSSASGKPCADRGVHQIQYDERCASLQSEQFFLLVGYELGREGCFRRAAEARSELVLSKMRARAEKRQAANRARRGDDIVDIR